VTRVVLTQPLPRVERTAARLAERGHEVLLCPLRRLVPQAGVAAAIGPLAECDWVVFVSPGAVAVALQALPGGWPRRTGIALIGPGSEQELADHGISAPAVRIVRPGCAPYDADALLRLAPFDSPRGLRVLVLAGTGGRTDWIDELVRRGALVRRASIYRSEALSPGDEVLRRMRRWSRDGREALFVFTTTDSVRELEQALAGARLRGWARRQHALAQHPRIAGLLDERGWRSTRLIEPGERALLAAIESV